MPEPLNQQIDRLQEILFSERDPDGRAFVSLADAHRRGGDLDRALEVLQEGLGTHPDSASGHVVAGWLHTDRGDDDSAIQAFERVLELDDENGAALRSLAGLVDARQGLSYAQRLVELEPDDAQAIATLEDLEAALAAEDATPEAVPVEALAPDEAEAPPDDVLDEPVLEVSARAEDSSEEPVLEAEPVAEEPAEEPAEGEIYTQTLAELYAKQGAADKAVEVYRKLLEDDPDNGMFLHRVAELTRGVDVGPVAGDEPEVPEVTDDRPVVPIESLAPDPEPVAEAAPATDDRPVVPIESLAPDPVGAVDAPVVSAEDVADRPADDRPVVPIASLAPDESAEGSDGDPFPWMNKL